MISKKYVAIALAVAAPFAHAADYWESWTSKVDPTKITLPKIKQTTSHDEVTQCTWYDASASFAYDPKEWPTTWEVGTSNGISKSAEFLALKKSIPWDSMPKNIPVRKMTPEGGIDMSGYDADNDPDCWWSSSTCTIPKHKGINADIYRCPEPETWGLTFDDGPNCSHNAFYDYLQDQKLKATMFYIGSNVINWPYGAMRGVRDGHHIAQHTWSHALMTTLSNDDVLAELYYTQKAIKMVTGITPRHWRPAFGDVDDRVRWIATQLNLTTILWDRDTDDWAAGAEEPMSTVQKHYEDFINMGTNGTYATQGNIVLQHEIDNTTMQLAIDYMPRIKKAYKHVLDVATCMNITHPYMENTVTFPSFAQAGKPSTNSTSSASASASHSAGAKPTSKASGSAAASSAPAGKKEAGASASSSGKLDQDESSASLGFMASRENAMLVAAAVLSALLV